MNDNLPPLPEHTGYMAHDYHLKAWDENDLRTYAAVAVAAALSDRHALQGRGAHPAPCARQCEAQAFRSEIAAEQRRSEMYADLVRRTAEALGLTREDGWHKLPERVAVLCEANECFGKRQEWLTGCPECGMNSGCDCDSGTWRMEEQEVVERDAEIASLREANERFGQRQEWWTEKMFELEQERDALKADADKHYAAGRAAEREACADICDQHASVEGIAQRCAAAIRARGQEESPPGEGGPKLRGRQQEESPGKDNGSL